MFIVYRVLTICLTLRSVKTIEDRFYNKRATCNGKSAKRSFRHMQATCNEQNSKVRILQHMSHMQFKGSKGIIAYYLKLV